MARNIFRKSSLDRISNPEQLNDYIRVTNPGVWMILCAVILLLFGLIFWSIFGQLDTYLPVGVVTENDQSLCYVKDADAQALKTDMLVWIGDEKFHITEIQKQPIQVDDSFAEYLLHVGDLHEGEWVYVAALDHTYGEDGMIIQAEIVIESIEPVRFVVN